MNLHYVVLSTLLCALVAVGYALFQKGSLHLHRKRHENARKRMAEDALQTAAAQRSIFYIEFQNKELQSYKLKSRCADIASEQIVFDVGDSFISSEWLGEETLVFFQVAVKGRPSFYQFRGNVSEIRRNDKTPTICLPVPGFLDPGQKRNFLRVSPPAEYVLHLRIWPLADSAPLPSTVYELSPTTLEYRPDLKETVLVNDISAGGVGVFLDITSPPEKMKLQKGSRLLCLLMLKSLEKGGNPLNLWLIGKIVVIATQSEEKNRLRLGVRFTHWMPMERQAAAFSWLPLQEDEGVTPLANWVIRRNFEESRMN